MKDLFDHSLALKDVIVYKVSRRWADLHFGVVAEVDKDEIKVVPVFYDWSTGARRGKKTPLTDSRRIALYDTKLMSTKFLSIIREIQDEI